MTDSPLGPAQRRIVDHLKRVGACTTGDLADALDVTTQAVRPPLAELESKGLVAANPVSTGVRGRPPLGWALTPIAIDLFPDRHRDLTVELLDAMKSALGEDALEKVLLERDRSQLAAVEADMPDGADIVTRVEVLAAARTRQGYMAEVVNEGDSMLLIEHHCPVCEAATTCQGLCANEIELFRTVVGPGAEVERTQHLLSGGDRCVYRIRIR
ncbi:MAG: MarR family transcriptional regulator [Actinobacteria bacterium]|nr:MarR family transcriptional regulator [Actinomycetota bacterium]